MSILDKVVGEYVPQTPAKDKIPFEYFEQYFECEVDTSGIITKLNKVYRETNLKAKTPKWNVDRFSDAKVKGKLSVIDAQDRVYTRTDEYADVWTGPNFSRWSTRRLIRERL